MKLGDSIKTLLDSVGITQERVEKYVGNWCRCKQRQRKLNALGTWAAEYVKGNATVRDLRKAMGDDVPESET